MGRLDDKIAFVTGGGRGIGAAIATKLSAEGARVFVADLVEASAVSTANSIEAAGGVAWPVVLDVTSYAACVAAIDAAVEQEGRLDVLVNNAGWDQAEPFVDSVPETWEKVIGINFLGVVHCCHGALKHMLVEQKGRIVSIGSDAGRVGSTGEAVYSGAKGGVIAFTKTIARENARRGIQANVVCPGPTATPLVAELAGDNPKLIDALRRAIPMGRLGEPSEVANAVAFFASDEAHFITGQTLSVSGGLTMS